MAQVGCALEQIQKGPRSHDADIFVRFEGEKMLIARYDKLGQTFNRGLDVLIVIRIPHNRMDAKIPFNRLGHQLERRHP